MPFDPIGRMADSEFGIHARYRRNAICGEEAAKGIRGPRRIPEVSGGCSATLKLGGFV
jgi:hypothetical protein